QQQQQAIAQQYQARAQQAQREFQTFANSSDAEFDNYARSQVGDQHYSEIQQEVRAMLRDYGLTDEQISREYNSNASFRSFAGQRLMFDAARWRLANKGVASKVARSVPQVRKPGSPLDRGNERDYQLDRLSAKLDKTGSARDAANLLIAQR